MPDAWNEALIVSIDKGREVFKTVTFQHFLFPSNLNFGRFGRDGSVKHCLVLRMFISWALTFQAQFIKYYQKLFWIDKNKIVERELN